jgi:hypothetical protein
MIADIRRLPEPKCWLEQDGNEQVYMLELAVPEWAIDDPNVEIWPHASAPFADFISQHLSNKSFDVRLAIVEYLIRAKTYSITLDVDGDSATFIARVPVSAIDT